MADKNPALWSVAGMRAACDILDKIADGKAMRVLDGATAVKIAAAAIRSAADNEERKFQAPAIKKASE